MHAVESVNGAGHRIITGFSNPLIKQVRALRDKKHRRAARQFLAEGLRILAEAQDAGHLPDLLFYADAARLPPRAAPLIRATEAAGSSIIATSTEILAKLSGKDNPQTMIGVYAEPSTALAGLDRSAASIWLVAQAMRDPGNLGTMLRTGDAVGAGGLILIDDAVDPFGHEVVRASMGAIFTQRVVQCRWEEFLAWYRAAPLPARGCLIATSLAADSVDYRQPAYPAPAFILIGNEAQGLPDAYAAACDVRVRMPMRGRADSLNAAVAAAVMAYQVLDAQSHGPGREARSAAMHPAREREA